MKVVSAGKSCQVKSVTAISCHEHDLLPCPHPGALVYSDSMKRTITATLIALALSANAPGQTLPEDISPDTPPIHYDLPVPEVRFNDRAVMFQASLYPDFYRTHSVRRDMRWVREQDTALMNFWDTRGDSVLWLLTQYSGLDWVEDKFDLFVLRYYPSFGGADPLVIPIGAMRQGPLAIAAPEGSLQQFNVIYQLAGCPAV